LVSGGLRQRAELTLEFFSAEIFYPAAANAKARARPQFEGREIFSMLPLGLEMPGVAMGTAPGSLPNARSVHLMAQASQVLASARTTSSKRARCSLQRHTGFIAKW
jgi:hypothetical protein